MRDSPQPPSHLLSLPCHAAPEDFEMPLQSGLRFGTWADAHAASSVVASTSPDPVVEDHEQHARALLDTNQSATCPDVTANSAWGHATDWPQPGVAVTSTFQSWENQWQHGQRESILSEAALPKSPPSAPPLPMHLLQGSPRGQGLDSTEEQGWGLSSPSTSSRRQNGSAVGGMIDSCASLAAICRLAARTGSTPQCASRMSEEQSAQRSCPKPQPGHSPAGESDYASPPALAPGGGNPFRHMHLVKYHPRASGNPFADPAPSATFLPAAICGHGWAHDGAQQACSAMLMSGDAGSGTLSSWGMGAPSAHEARQEGKGLKMAGPNTGWDDQLPKPMNTFAEAANSAQQVGPLLAGAGVCLVCLDAERDWGVLPCLHMVGCHACTAGLCAAGGPCPVCCQAVQGSFLSQNMGLAMGSNGRALGNPLAALQTPVLDSVSAAAWRASGSCYSGPLLSPCHSGGGRSTVL